MTPSAIPLSLYAHLPWCARKCPYCDFNSYTASAKPPYERYVDALLEDLRSQAALAGGRPLLSVFLGGGTPSLFQPDQIARILDGIRSMYVLAADAEVTMEANPGSIECGRLAGYRDAGVNRLSLGAQSFDARMLTALGRLHGPEATASSVREARDAGFDNLNLDVMYALPGQSVDMALADIRSAARLSPEHLSWYHLTLEPNTVFHARPPAGLPDADLAADIQEAGEALLASLGFERYEVSAWARSPARRARHNLNYWSFGDYLAAGAGAHGKLTTADGIMRYRRPDNPEAYMRAMAAAERGPVLAAVAGPELGFEFMLNALRLNRDIDLEVCRARTGLAPETFEPAIERLVADGLIAVPGPARIRTTPLGWQRLNDVMAAFLPESAD